MATAYQNLSDYDFNSVPDASDMNVGIVVAEWNKVITEKLLEGACNTLERHGVKPENIIVKRVPGSFELTFGAKRLADEKDVDAVIVFIFGLLTTDNMQQAEDRAGGKYGNKGDEAAVTAIKMIDFSCKLQN